MNPPINGMEQRLDLLLDEIRGLRADLARRAPAPPEDGSIELREPEKPKKARR